MPSRSNLLTAGALLLIMLVGAALRLDVLVSRYGPLGGPGWMQALQKVSPAARAVRPDGVRWRRDREPYVGGDPVNYVKYAREMTGFYQAHVREPVFLAVTRGFLWLTGGRDIAVSFASALSSLLAVAATFVLGASASTRLVGLGAAAALAIEMDAVNWSPDGWRDSTFALFVALTAAAFVRLRQSATRHDAFVAGVLGGLTCLTRLSALGLVVAGGAWLLVEAPRAGRGTMARRVVLVMGMTLAVTGPYLFACARAYGDPFYAVNYHTRYYRAAEGLASAEESALGFMARQVTTRPFAAVDTAAAGLVTWPIEKKWRGFNAWSPRLARVLRWAAIAGIAGAFWFPDGRLLVVMALASLVPYMFTWSLGGGGEWRFTEHVYPFYLVAASQALVWTAAGIRALVRRPHALPRLSRPRMRQAALFAAAVALAALAWLAWPALLMYESVRLGEPIMAEAGDRDSWLFTGGWSRPERGGNVTVRAAGAEPASVRFILPGPWDGVLTLRMDPVEPARGPAPSVHVFLNGDKLDEFTLTSTPGRVGSYSVRVPAARTRRGVNRVDLVASHAVAARDAGRHFTWLPGDRPVAFRFWYLRFVPQNGAAATATDGR